MLASAEARLPHSARLLPAVHFRPCRPGRRGRFFRSRASPRRAAELRPETPSAFRRAERVAASMPRGARARHHSSAGGADATASSRTPSGKKSSVTVRSGPTVPPSQLGDPSPGGEARLERPTPSIIRPLPPAAIWKPQNGVCPARGRSRAGSQRTDSVVRAVRNVSKRCSDHSSTQTASPSAPPRDFFARLPRSNQPKADPRGDPFRVRSARKVRPHSAGNRNAAP